MQQQLFLETHQNHHLFSDHYLNDVLPRLEIWKEAEGTTEVLEKIRKRYLRFRDTLPSTNEPQLETDWVRPILRLLGHYFEPQVTAYLGDDTYRPDYTFFANEEARLEARKKKGCNEIFKTALAVGDAKYWDRPLDKKIKGKGNPFDNSNPNYQIDIYLRATAKKWGLLTNGRLWRLYNRDTSFSMDSFYEVDLVKLIQQGDPEQFKYFYLFFRRQAFEPFDTKPSFLDFVYEESSTHTVSVQKDLKERVYEALRVLANGFLRYPGNNLDPIQDKKAIHDNCLILLYRLLFVFYAEARNLMPGDSDYRFSFGFDRMKKQIHERRERGENISPVTTDYWGRLKALFMLLNDPSGLDGKPMYGMPQYNGGLFDPKKHPFLEQYTIGDQAMAEAFDCLACTTTKDGPSFVDYRDLEVQHLGSIYEGLLEYKLEYADQDKVVIKGKKKQEIVANKADHPELPVVYHQGEYFLITDKGERKTTGSYYTPDYIVRYIVENTLQPLVDRCKNYQEILELNILDPAMGSGHFLVGVVDFLAEQIVYHPTTPLLEEGNEGKEIAHWRRRVAERCVYGVDVNPLAVELAKLSLWLHTVSYGKPLSFLDHHLRCGNSLIGARVKDMHELPEVKKKKKVPSKSLETGRQLTLFENRFLQQVSLAVGHYLLIEQMETHSKEDIEKKEDLLKIAEEHLQRFKETANVWVSVYFGNELNRDDYHRLLEALQNNRFAKMKNLPFFKRAQEIAQEKRFFHWEMEFPDVFFDRHGRWLDNPGFDGVVGNPPYIRYHNLDSTEINYFRSGYQFAKRQFDAFVLMIERCYFTLREMGSFGYIVPDLFLRGLQYEDARKFINQRCILKQVCTLGDGVFENVQMPTCLIFFQPARLIVDHKSLFRNGIGERLSIEIRQNSITEVPGVPFNPHAAVIIGKIRDISWKLGDISWITRGIEIGKDKVFNYRRKHSDVEVLSGDEIRPFIPIGVRYVDFAVFKEYAKDESIFRSPKIMIRETGGEIFGCYDEDNKVTLRTVHNIHIKHPHTNPLYVLAILNSKLTQKLFELCFRQQGDVFPKIRIEQERQLLIRKIEPIRVDTKDFNELQLLVQSENYKSVLKYIEALQTRREFTKIIHDLLVILTKSMLSDLKKKQLETNTFIEWIYVQLKDEIHKVPQSFLRTFYNISSHDFLEEINSRKVHLSPQKAAEIRAQFEQTVSVIKPLIAHIEKTDWLIDQIVYRLYGLTEEIRVVEESMGRTSGLQKIWDWAR